jgi:hypothetical protein
MACGNRDTRMATAAEPVEHLKGGFTVPTAAFPRS